MPAMSCVWDTVANWAALAGQDESVYLAFKDQGGTAYCRTCADGTIKMNKELFDAISDV